MAELGPLWARFEVWTVTQRPVGKFFTPSNPANGPSATSGTMEKLDMEDQNPITS